ncbi:hypothetical protein DLC15_05250 [Salmonella enterica subsp. enterica serovar Telelkebir]|nr:hypothetical protein [Salmonella enterica subsp. enterica serovar Telelkebir]ECC3295662.1 hypothetical protein [Salmonella enterica subsp. enterica]EDR2888317.1 hypothetical protein [Salmonella enterica subsp. enterica]EDR6140838.1 hypothetical protein [Salmonella enterica subsp. enterica]EDU9860160.1 hypothetical protein [Salmonella enterica subsp. enterica]
MFWLDNSSGVTDMPKIPAKLSPVAQWFTEGGNGKAPAYPGAHWYNIVQAELLNVLAAAEVEPDKTKLDQLLTAINILIKSKTDELGGYLEIEKLLSEIKDKGEAAQKTSRENIGIEGDIAYRDQDNKFTRPNTFDNYLISNLALRICAPNDKKLICDISGAYVDLAYKTTFARIRSVSGNLVGGAYHFLVNSPDELILEDTSKKKQYVTYNTGNLTPVLSVNNNKPDANGNVTVSVGGTYSNSALLAVPGWHEDTSTGMIKQWGRVTTPSDGTYSITFPKPFPAETLSVTLTEYAPSGGTIETNLTVISISKTGMTIKANGKQSDQQVMWEVLGH